MTSNKKHWALITGAAGGIGRALVKSFADAGYCVIATDIEEQRLDGRSIIHHSADLEKIAVSEEYAIQFAKEIKSITQGVGITVLINNAAKQILQSFEYLTRLQWQTSLNVNLSAPFLLIQMFLTDLMNNNGSIVNISSIHANLTKKRFVAYATAKAGLSALTRNLAIDLGPKVRVNAIEPAAVCTEMLKEGFAGNAGKYEQLKKFHPLCRVAEPIEIAELALFLCSEKAKFIQGACISASGGIHGCLHDPD